MNFKIGKCNVGVGKKAFIVAELSGNHNQSLDRAKRLIKYAKLAGADAVKLQTYTADTITLKSNKNDVNKKKYTCRYFQVLKCNLEFKRRIISYFFHR